MIRKDYEVMSVEPAEAPNDMGGADWYRYIIGQGANRICGYRRGDVLSIRQSVEEIVLRLNERRIGKRGRVHIDMSARSGPANSK